MVNKHTMFNAAARKYSWSFAVAAAASLLLAGNSVSAEKAKNDRAVRLLATVTIPPTADNTTANALYSFDISWVDQATQTYYLADRV